MTAIQPTTRATLTRNQLVIDIVCLLLISLFAETAHFSQRQGRVTVSGDSAQHVDGAEALLSSEKSPNFGFRKPGYTIILAAIGWLTGNMSWSASIANHLFLAMLPLAAYGLGIVLVSRLAGWIAAILLVAQLQIEYRADRVMSEASYTFFLTFGLLALAIALRHKSIIKWMLYAGIMLACAWLIRSIGIAAVIAATLVTLAVYRTTPRKACLACVCLLTPLALTVLLECSLNYNSQGHFSPSPGPFGVMLQTRARYLQGSPLPDTPTTDYFLGLLPERTRDDAFLVNKLDGCVARNRAFKRDGLDDWAFNQLATKSGEEIIAADPQAYIRTGAAIFMRQLLRRTGEPALSLVPPTRLLPIIQHASAIDFEESQRNWFGYWFLPQLSLEESTNLAQRIQTAANQPAPLGSRNFWHILRYYSTHPIIVDSLATLRAIGSLWPGLAILFAGLLGLHRPTCALLALAYLGDAAIVAICGATEIANERYQFVWIATDRVLVACLIAPIVAIAWQYVYDSLNAAGSKFSRLSARLTSPSTSLQMPSVRTDNN